MVHYCLTRLYNNQLRSNFLKNGYNSVRSVVTASTDKIESAELANAKPFEEMPSLPMLPLIGSGWVYFPLVGKYSKQKLHLANKEKYKKYGNIVREKIGPFNMVMSFEPETMEILFRHEGQYPKRGEFSTLKAYRKSRKNWYKSLGVMLLQGKEWYDLRSKTQKHLMKPKSIQAYLNPMQDVARDLISLMRIEMDSNKEVPEMLEKLYKWALESVALVGLDTRLGCLDPNLPADADGRKMISSVQSQFHCMNKLEAASGSFQFWRYFETPTWKKFTREADIFTEIAFKYINQSLENLKKNVDEDKELTLLQCLLMEKGLEASGAMVMVADMLMAGIDTTSHAVGFLLYHLAKNPEKQEILYSEIRHLLPNKEERITPESFGELRYLKACLKEAMRLDPVVRGNVRAFDHDVVVSGYRIPAGTAVVCIVQEIYRNEKYFKDASTFLPERWLDKDNYQINPFAFVPFGIGPRSCIGRRLAELEMLCLATEVIRNFKVEYHYEDMGMITRLVNYPSKPLRFSFVDR